MKNNLISTNHIIVNTGSTSDVVFNLYKEEDLKEDNKSLGDFFNINYKSIEENEIFFHKKEENKLFFIVKIKNENIATLRKIGASIGGFVKKENFSSILLKNNTNFNDIEIIRGIVDKSYSFSKYLSEKGKKTTLKEISIESKTQYNDKSLKELNDEIKSLYLIRDLVNEPANVVFPGSVEELALDLFEKKTNVNLKIFNLEDLKQMNANLLIAVGLGFDAKEKQPRMITIEYKGNKNKEDFDMALVGKGVTFDSGGYSLKPAKSMETMKGDMAGSANVLGIMHYIIENNLNINIVGTLALTENMVNGNATKPGDIVKSMSGLTVEILNTDAEGRLILADALYWTEKEYKPKYLLNFATLTGAIVVALGTERAGLFSNSEHFANLIKECSKNTNEKTWEMPIGEDYTDLMKSKIADLRNISLAGGEGSSCTAAAFLEKFINGNQNWIHLDIAGVSDYEKDHQIYGLGASAWGFRLIKDFIEKNLLKKNN